MKLNVNKNANKNKSIITHFEGLSLITYIYIVNRKECLWLGSFFFQKSDAVMSHFRRCDNNSVHVLAKHLGDSDLVFLVDGLTQIH